MTLEQTKLANLGRSYWQHYVNINGYAFSPNRAGLAKLSKHLGIRIKHLSLAITIYLSA